MHLLILGGTQFVGRHIVEIALERGHTLTLFNRGNTNPDLFPGVEHLTGDRDPEVGVGLSALEGRSWDAVIDVSGYVPRHVQATVDLLHGQVGHYTFISTISVYDQTGESIRGLDESGPLKQLDDPTVEEITGETYGGLKVLCEKVVTEAFADSAASLRPCVVVGPHDHTDRFNYWVWRLAQGGDVLAPGTPDNEMLIVDVRDLARFALDVTEGGVAGVYNVVADPIPWGQALEAMAQAGGEDVTLHWAPVDFLRGHEAAGWDHVPLYIPETGEAIGMQTISNLRAKGVGLGLTPFATTVRDTLDWLRTRPDAHEWRTGMSREREADLLSELAD